MPHPRRLMLLLAALAAPFLLSCTEESVTECPTFNVGAVEGRVVAAGDGLSTRVRARALDGPNAWLALWDTQSDSTGWYRLDLPSGLFRIELGQASEFRQSNSQDPRDTVSVASQVVRRDLVRARTEIRILMPPELEDHSIRLGLEAGSWDDHSDNRRVQSGELVFDFPPIQPNTYTLELGGSGLENQFLPGTFRVHEADTFVIGPQAIQRLQFDFTDRYASISGQVTGGWQAAEQPTPFIIAFDLDGRQVYAGNCLPDGSFTVDLLFPAPVRIKIRGSRGYLYQWVGGNTEETATVFLPDPGDRITGVDVVESGLLIGLNGPATTGDYDFMVVVRDAEGEVHRTNYSSEGPYYLGNLRPGRYFVQVSGICERQSWAAQWYGDSATLADAVPVDLGPGEYRYLEFDLEAGGRIAGQVLMPDLTAPEAVDVGVFDHQGDPFCENWRQFQRFEGGVFSFPGLPEGQYYLGVDRYFDTPWWYPGTFGLTEAEPLSLAAHDSLGGVTWTLPGPSPEAGP